MKKLFTVILIGVLVFCAGCQSNGTSSNAPATPAPTPAVAPVLTPPSIQGQNITDADLIDRINDAYTLDDRGFIIEEVYVGAKGLYDTRKASFDYRAAWLTREITKNQVAFSNNYNYSYMSIGGEITTITDSYIEIGEMGTWAVVTCYYDDYEYYTGIDMDWVASLRKGDSIVLYGELELIDGFAGPVLYFNDWSVIESNSLESFMIPWAWQLIKEPDTSLTEIPAYTHAFEFSNKLMGSDVVASRFLEYFIPYSNTLPTTNREMWGIGYENKANPKEGMSFHRVFNGGFGVSVTLANDDNSMRHQVCLGEFRANLNDIFPFTEDGVDYVRLTPTHKGGLDTGWEFIYALDDPGTILATAPNGDTYTFIGPFRYY